MTTATTATPISDWLKTATKKLKDGGIITARLDCLVLLEDCLSIDRARILAHPDFELKPEQIKWLNFRIAERIEHKPLAYIRERCEFYGRTFFVDQRVLVPRPETEPIIDFLKSIPNKKSMQIADIGAGSGCIGITVALELPPAKVDLYDIDPSTFAVAEKNAKDHQVKVSLYEGDLLLDLVTDYDIIIANLPYVPNGRPENVDVYFEPSHALFAGDDGLNLYRAFWHQAGSLKHKPTYVFTESRPQEQQPTLTKLAAAAGYKLAATDNFIQEFELTQ